MVDPTSTLRLRPATKADVPSLVGLWYACFFQYGTVARLFPDTEAVRKWYRDGFELCIEGKGENGVSIMVGVESLGGGEKEEVVSYVKYITEPPTHIRKWQETWGTIPLNSGLDEQAIEDDFFAPMARQHAIVMKGKEHLFLEVIATHPSYQKRGLAGKMLTWGKEYADELGMDLYLDGGKKASALYEKFGYEKFEEMQDEKCSSIPMVRRVGK